MMFTSASADAEKQIEAAFNYRGHVTVRLKGGESVEGYLFNRRFDDTERGVEGFIELFLKSNGERRKYSVAAVETVALTGEDCAAGKSYEDHLKKKAAEQKPGA